MAPVRAHRTIPGCPDAYKRCSARNNPRLVRAVPHRRTAACAQRPLRHTARRLDLRRDFDKTNPSASVHAPPTRHTTHFKPSLPTAQGLAQAEKPKPAWSGPSQPKSLHGRGDGEATSIRSSCARQRAASLRPLARLARAAGPASWTVKIMAAPPRRAGRPGLKQLLWHEERERG